MSTRYEGGVYIPSGEEPGGTEAWLKHYGNMSRYLELQNQEKHTTTDKIANVVLRVELLHGIEQSFPHGLGFVPSAVIPMGRVQFLSGLRITQSTISFKSKLLTSTIINPTFYQPQNRIQVADPEFFQVGDLVRLGTKNARVLAINDLGLLLDAALVYSVYSLSLAQDNVRLFIF